MKTTPWQSPDAIVQLNHLDRPGFAFEFLRRNRSYRRDYRHVSRDVTRGETDAADAQSRLARRWGLQFCPRP